MTIPDWGYINTPVAELEIMMADLPHIQYHPKDNFSDEILEAGRIVKEDIKKKSRSGGLAAALGLNVEDVSGFNKGRLENGKLTSPE